MRILSNIPILEKINFQHVLLFAFLFTVLTFVGGVFTTPIMPFLIYIFAVDGVLFLLRKAPQPIDSFLKVGGILLVWYFVLGANPITFLLLAMTLIINLLPFVDIIQIPTIIFLGGLRLLLAIFF